MKEPMKAYKSVKTKIETLVEFYTGKRKKKPKLD